MGSGAGSRLAVVIPAYNEAGSISAVVEGLVAAQGGAEIVVVDDGSRDNTVEVLRSLPVHRIRHPVNLGQGAALQTGITYAAGLGVDYIVTFDADGQHRPEDIPRLLEPLVRGECDVVLGSRFLDAAAIAGIPPTKRVVLRLATLFTRLSTGLALTDTHNGLRAFRATAAPLLEMRINGMAHASEILERIARSGLRWREVPVVVGYTDYSRAKGQRVTNSLNILWELFFRR